MLTKKKAGDGKVRVGFSLPADVAANGAVLCGEFTDWTPSRPMKRAKDGDWRVSVALAAGRTYRFRYLVDGERWENDWHADAYVPNPYGGEDSVVMV